MTQIGYRSAVKLSKKGTDNRSDLQSRRTNRCFLNNVRIDWTKTCLVLQMYVLSSLEPLEKLDLYAITIRCRRSSSVNYFFCFSFDHCTTSITEFFNPINYIFNERKKN